jgi:hypothetical protein
MKFPILRSCAVSILILMAFVLVGGCTSAGSGKGAYSTFKHIRMDVDWPMTRYRNAVAAGGVTLAEKQQVDAAYSNFQKAFDAALQAAQSNDEATAPDNVKALADQVIAAIAAIPF